MEEFSKKKWRKISNIILQDILHLLSGTWAKRKSCGIVAFVKGTLEIAEAECLSCNSNYFCPTDLVLW
jgi:hypothetical protein